MTQTQAQRPVASDPIKGLIIPTLTPFTPDGALNEALVERLARQYADLEVPALFVGGTTGEFALLTVDERKRLLEASIRGAGGRTKIIAHTGAATPAEVLELSQHAHEAGANAVAVVTPYYYGYQEEDLLKFYQWLCRSIPALQIYAYTIPQRAGNTLHPQSLKALQEEPNFAGIKDSSGDMYRLLDLIDVQGLSVLAGADDLCLPFMSSGGHGLVSGPGGVAPELFLAFFKAVESGDQARASRLAGYIRDLSTIVKGGGRIDYLKAGLVWRGGESGVCRAPLPNLGEEDRRTLVSALEELASRLSTDNINLSRWAL